MTDFGIVAWVLARLGSAIDSAQGKRDQRDLERAKQVSDAEHQRLVHRSSLYDSERQGVYARLYELVLMDEANLRALLQGPTRIPTFTDIEDDDLDRLLPDRNFNNKVRRQIRELLPADPVKAQEVFENYMVQTALPHAAREAHDSATRYFHLKALYLSPEVEQAVKEVLDGLFRTLQQWEHGHDPAVQYLVVDAKKIQDKLAELRSRMRIDISGVPTPAPDSTDNDKSRLPLVTLTPKVTPTIE